jgi:hypothetical protein
MPAAAPRVSGECETRSASRESIEAVTIASDTGRVKQRAGADAEIPDSLLRDTGSKRARLSRAFPVAGQDLNLRPPDYETGGLPLNARAADIAPCVRSGA